MCKEAIPPQAMINNLEMDEAPFEELNTLELHLISPILLFYKIVLLPKSDQRVYMSSSVCKIRHDKNNENSPKKY